MVLKKCERLVAIASANFPDDLLKDILVPALSFADPDNYWQQATANLMLAVAEHQVGEGDMREGRLWLTLTTLTRDNVLNNLSGERRDHYARMEPGHLVTLVACVHAYLKKIELVEA